MHYLTNYFVSNPSSAEVILYGGIILSLWLLEAIIVSTSFKDKWKHTVTNLLFIATALPVQLFMTIFVLMVAGWVAVNHWGLLYLLPFHNSFVVKYVVGFILLDFCEYVYHVIMHKAKPLWKFHLVHHSDLELDVSTTVREHPAETFIRMCFLIIWVYLLGASFGVLLLRQTIQTISNITSHTQFRLSGKVEKITNWFFITPNLHHVHHHYQLPYTDCNYGDILSIWDRIFNTYNSHIPPDEIIFGIDSHMDKKCTTNFLEILKTPFSKFPGKEKMEKL